MDVDRVNDSNSLRDIWADDDSNSNSNTKTKRQVVPLKRKLAVPNPGFSYNPRKDNHQDAIAEALALEIEKRDKVDAEKKSKFFTNTSSVIDYYDNNHDDDEDDNDDDENDNTNGFSNPRSKPKNRAQRNKERARKVLEYEKSRERLELQVLGEVEKIPLLLKEIEKDERERALKKALKNNKQSTLSTLTYEEAGLIPLSDELNGSLRRIKPKGAGIKIRANDMKTNGDLVTEGKRKRYIITLSPDHNTNQSSTPFIIIITTIDVLMKSQRRIVTWYGHQNINTSSYRSSRSSSIDVITLSETSYFLSCCTCTCSSSINSFSNSNSCCCCC